MEEGSKNVVIFTDGACKQNGSKSAVGGIGVFWGEGSPRNVSSRVHLLKVTNNICELLAIQTAVAQILILLTDEMNDCKYVIASDSKYAISCLTVWYPGFIKRGWLSATGTAIKNKELISSIKEKLDIVGNRISFKYVKAHCGNVGNEAADRLASAACS